MCDLKSIINIFSDSSIKEIGKLISKLVDLYIMPVKVWKKVINYRNSSFDTFILYLLYHIGVLYLIVLNLKLALKFTFFDILITAIAFTILIIPFYFFRRIFKKKIKSNRLFRLIFVFKIQLFPLIYIPIFVAKWANIESPYIISDNAVMLFPIFLIVVIPLLLRISIPKKIIWIVTNYIFLNLFLILSSYIHDDSPDLNKLYEKLNSKSPNEEFISFHQKFNNSDMYLSNEFFIVIGKIDPDSLRFDTQFASFYLLDELARIDKNLEKRLNPIFKDAIHKNYLRNYNRKKLLRKYQYVVDSTKIRVNLQQNEILTKPLLDSLRNSFNSKFYSDIRLCDSLKDVVKFKSNKNYLNDMYLYLNQFDSIYSNKVSVRNIITNNEIESRYLIDGYGKLILLKLNLSDLKMSYEKIVNNDDKLWIRKEKSLFLNKYLYYPLYIFRKRKVIIIDEFENLQFHENK